MFITNATDYDNMTDDCNYTNNDNNNILCLISFMVYTIIEPLKTK